MTGAGNLVLTGFMATGKSTIGRLLADRLDLEFIDTDQIIEERHGPIPEIFETQGEDTFRAMERSLAGELGARTGLIIATGGRMLLDPKNLEALGRHGTIVCLVAGPDELLRRIRADGSLANRPLLADDDPEQRIAELLAERAPGYARFTQVATEGLAPEDVVSEVTRIWLGLSS
jgi:shikimate kinase